MKKTNAFIAAALAASIFTSCGGTDTAEVTSAESTTAATVSETDTTSTESEETTTETSVETTASVSDTEAIEEAENTHWDTIVYDTTLKVDVTEWDSDENAVNSVNQNTFCTLSEEVDRLSIPDAVTSYLYENSVTYRVCFDSNEEIRGIVSGGKDFDSDGVEETLYAVNYLAPYHDESLYGDWTPSVGRMGAYPSDIVVYDAADEKVYLCDTGDLTCVGCYFAADPAVECKSLDTSRYEECFTCEGTNMYFTEDNIFISCNLGEMDYMGYADTYNRYDRLVYENGEYKVQSVGRAGWRLNIPLSEVEYTETHECYRAASVDGDIPCVLK